MRKIKPREFAPRTPEWDHKI